MVTTEKPRVITRASAKAAGRNWANRTVQYLHPVFSTAERRVLSGRFDKGDIINTGDWTIECKAVRKIDLAGFSEQAKQECRNTGTRWWALVVKRRNHLTGKAYAVMDLEQLRDLIAYLHELEARNG